MPFGSFPFDGEDINNYLYPQFFADPKRPPTANDIQLAGTRWQDNSVSPAIIYVTIGGGVWYVDAGVAPVTVVTRLAVGSATGPQVLSGAGSPAGLVTAPQGSLYLNTTGSSVSTRAFINTNSGTTWAAVTTAA